MASNKSSGNSGGIGFFGLLTILFIGLKLTNYINWSWWWVLSPIWIPIAIAVAIVLISFTVEVIQHLIKQSKKKRK